MRATALASRISQYNIVTSVTTFIHSTSLRVHASLVQGSGSNEEQMIKTTTTMNIEYLGIENDDEDIMEAQAHVRCVWNRLSEGSSSAMLKGISLMVGELLLI